jgi:hypothetical protein
MLALVVLAPVILAIIAGTLVVTYRDGYGRIRTW